MQVNSDEYKVTTGRKRRRQWDDDLNTGSDDDSGANPSEIKKRNFANDEEVISSTTNLPPVPPRFVSEAYGSWHHGAISRKHSEALLSGSPDGVFLMRESTNFPGDHTLCVRFQGRVEHYRVKCRSRDQRLTIDDEELFDSLIDLIEHYSTFADGLCTKLGRWLPNGTIINSA